jgi:hypothetical protein
MLGPLCVDPRALVCVRYLRAATAVKKHTDVDEAENCGLGPIRCQMFLRFFVDSLINELLHIYTVLHSRNARKMSLKRQISKFLIRVDASPASMMCKTKSVFIGFGSNIRTFHQITSAYRAMTISMDTENCPACTSNTSRTVNKNQGIDTVSKGEFQMNMHLQIPRRIPAL